MSGAAHSAFTICLKALVVPLGVTLCLKWLVEIDIFVHTLKALVVPLVLSEGICTSTDVTLCV